MNVMVTGGAGFIGSCIVGKLNSCGSDNIYIDIHENFSRVSDFQRYNFDDNLRLIQRVCNEVEFLKNSVPEEARIYTARYPESVVCGEN